MFTTGARRLTGTLSANVPAHGERKMSGSWPAARIAAIDSAPPPSCFSRSKSAKTASSSPNIETARAIAIIRTVFQPLGLVLDTRYLKGPNERKNKGRSLPVQLKRKQVPIAYYQ